MKFIARIYNDCLSGFYSKIYQNEIEKANVILQPQEYGSGFFAHFINFCGELKWAIDQGKKPYIDMATFPNAYLKVEEVGSVNAWELYFEQPFSEEEYREAGTLLYKTARKYKKLGKQRFLFHNNHEKQVVFFIRNHMGYLRRPSDSCEFLTNEKAISLWRDFIRKYIHPTPMLLCHIENLKNSCFQSPKRHWAYFFEEQIFQIIDRGITLFLQL